LPDSGKTDMTGLALLEKAFRLEKTERSPWVPFVGVHGGRLIGIDAETYLKSAEHMVDGISKAIELYKPDGIPVVFDLQLEAEILGCKLAWNRENPPAVVSHPLAEGIELNSLSLPEKTNGRIPIVLAATSALHKKFPDLALYGLITGPFTLALHLLGTEIFMKIFEDPEYVHRLMDFCTGVGIRYSDMLLDAGCDVIAVVDPMTSQIDPESFVTFVSPFARRIFDYVRLRKKHSSFFVCGHAQQNIEVMCDCRPDNISIDENIPLDYVKEIALAKGISFGGNLKLTVVLLMGTPDDARRDALACLDAAGDRGFILSPGCDLPMATPVENIKAVSELVFSQYLQQVTRNLEKTGNKLDILNMKDYGQADKVIVDIITLDSESCAPCQYMVEAVKRVAPHFEGVVEWREHPIKKLEAVSFMSSLMVKNIPTICIDGKIAFVSQIPPQNQLIEAIQRRINEKLKLKIKSKRSEILILGESEQECREVSGKVKRAVTELGKTTSVEVVTDREQLKSFGISKGPAVIIVSYKLKSEITVPSLEVIKEWIKEI
jgi:uroporphyrinogen decarboxylase